jgi:glucose-6-phosphate 1-dehydrogenase
MESLNVNMRIILKWMIIQNLEIKIANRSFENVSQLTYLGMTVTNQNLIQEEIKRRLNSGNACYHSVPEPSVFSSAVKKLKNQNLQDDNFACRSVWV